LKSKEKNQKKKEGGRGLLLANKDKRRTRKVKAGCTNGSTCLSRKEKGRKHGKNEVGGGEFFCDDQKE